MTQKRFRRLLMSCGVSRRITDAYVEIAKRFRLPYASVMRGLVPHSLADRWLMHVVLDCHGIVEDDEQGGYFAWTWHRGAFHRFTVMASEICAALPEGWLQQRMINVSQRKGQPAKVRVIKTQMIKEEEQ